MKIYEKILIDFQGFRGSSCNI